MQVTIRLAGVAAVGPGWPRQKKPPFKAKGPLYAIMPGSSRRQNEWSKVNGGKMFLPIHQPTIVTRSTDWDPRSRGTDVDPVDIGQWSLWYPYRERLELIIDDDDTPGDIEFQHLRQAADDGTPEGDVHHIADMRRIWPSRSKLKSAMRPGKAVDAPVTRTVAAQFLVSKGHVKSAFRRLNPWKARFDPVHTKNGQPVEQVLAPELLISRDVKSKVEFRSWSLDTGEQLDSIVFRPTKDLEVRIGNSDPADLFALFAGTASKERTKIVDGSRDGKPDYDFELYYDVLTGKGRGLSVPCDADPHTGFIRNCYLTFVEK